MRLIRATQHDFDGIIVFYDDVTVHTPDMALYARWSKGKHPTESASASGSVDNNISMLRIPAGQTFISLNFNNSVVWIK